MTIRVMTLRALALGFAAAALAAGAQAQTAGHTPTDEGKRVYERANCMGCHKWHGDGGGGYGGAALSLRRTELSRDQIIETVRCGRPGRGMPYHDREAYDGDGCYGLNRSELAGTMPPAAAVFLREADIEAVTDYVLANIKGKGEPSYADCIAFFGAASHMCHIYQPGPSGTAPSGTATAGTAPSGTAPAGTAPAGSGQQATTAPPGPEHTP